MMLGHIFYFFGLIVLLLNIYSISKYKRVFELREWLIKFKKVTGRNPVATDYRKSDDKEVLVAWSSCVVSTSFWTFFGLLTKSWYIFLALMIFNTLLNLLCRVFGEFSKTSYFLTFIKSIILLLITGFLIINHFHLHLDIWKILKSIT